MSGFFGRIFVGFLVSTPVVCIVVGGVQDALFLMFVSIICTAGVGLVAWIPLWWCVGWVTLKVLQRSDNQPMQALKRPEPSSQARLAMLAYIRKAMATGMDVDEITRRLKFNGWDESEIQKAHQSFTSLKPESTTETS